MKNRLARRFLIGLVALAADLLLLRYANPALWLQLWPRPALFVLLGGFAIYYWFPELFRGVNALRIAGVGMVFLGQCYLLHSLQVLYVDRSPIALVHFLCITGTFLVMTLNYINQIRPKNNVVSPPLPTELPYVAAIVPTYGEPCDILERTVTALRQLDYPAERLFIVVSDDSHREEVRRLADRHGVHYNLGPRKNAKAGNLNSALHYLERHFPLAELILTQDADEIIYPSFLQKTVGYFADPGIAFVQTPKDVITPPGDPFGTRDRFFYDVLQPGRNGFGAAFSCGSGVLWQLSAIQSIGGFATWNIVEDLTTSYLLHSAGFRSEYHNEILSIGLSPHDIPGVLKQRSTWATDTWRLFLFKNPLRRPGLTLFQRLQYLELGVFYTASVFIMPLLMIIPMLSLATGHFIPIQGSILYSWVVISLIYYAALARGNPGHLMRSGQYWMSHWPTYAHALWIAVRSRHKKPSYTVTRKTRQNGFYGHLIWPQFLFIGLSLVLIARGLFWMPEASLLNRLSNIALLLMPLYMVSAICRAAFYGVSVQDIIGGHRRAHDEQVGPLAQHDPGRLGEGFRPLDGTREELNF